MCFLICDNIGMCIVNKQVELLEFVFIPFMLTFNMKIFFSLLLMCMWPCVASVVIFGRYVRLSWYLMCISDVRGMREVGGMCEMCMYLALGGAGGDGGEWMRGLGSFAFPILWEQGEC